MQCNSPAAVNTPPTVIGRDIALEMSNFMLSHPGCTREDLREDFSDRQITRYHLEAKGIADRRRVRRQS